MRDKECQGVEEEVRDAQQALQEGPSTASSAALKPKPRIRVSLTGTLSYPERRTKACLGDLMGRFGLLLGIRCRCGTPGVRILAFPFNRIPFCFR